MIVLLYTLFNIKELINIFTPVMSCGETSVDKENKSQMDETLDKLCVENPVVETREIGTQVERPHERPSERQFETPSECPTETSLQETPVFSVPHQYYVGPAMFCSQPLPPSADCVIASGFSFPPPPLPEYYVGPALFHTSQPPPLPCCVAASRFCYPPPLIENLVPWSP
ncbi:PREDICTED: uncharacterized protein LOC107165062, partial [Diuraphis noxia]|uniref:uncharacterized protein LOC107165062 n=1 Tax=Diuraphis noxia TaxID=143948 RepID=UPI0007635B04